MYRVSAKDQNDVPRCFGIGETKEEAREECLLAVYENYINSERGRSMSVYGLEKEERESIDSILENLPTLEVVSKYKAALQDMTDKVCDEVKSYMEDEYACRFEETILAQAKKIVEGLLRGENLEAFGLRLRKSYASDDLFVYDGAKCREKIVKDFLSDIQNAEIHELKAENKRLNDALAYEGRRY